MKKDFLKFKILIYMAVSLVMSMFLFNANITAFASEEVNEYSNKVYCDIDISEDFDDLSVIIVLDKKISGINKEHDIDFFNGIDVIKIEDLTVVTDVNTVNEENFEQILLLTLSQHSKQNVIDSIDKLYLIEGIKYAGANVVMQNAGANVVMQNEVIPDDLFYINSDAEKSQWALEKISAPEAWDFNVGSNNVRVGIIDTGISYHEDLDNRVIAAYDFYSTTSNTPVINRQDTHSHGTHVAGIVGAEGNNSLGISGANWNVSLVQMKVGISGGSPAAIVRALNWAKNNWNTENRISIINYSLGNYAECPEIESAIRGYCDNGGLFVCSTGNLEQDNDLSNQHHYPSFMHLNYVLTL